MQIWVCEPSQNQVLYPLEEQRGSSVTRYVFAGVLMAVGLALIHTVTGCKRLRKAIQDLMKFCLAPYPDSIAGS